MGVSQYEHSEDDALLHYGVLGMKWGVRKDGAPQGTEGWAKNVENFKKEVAKRSENKSRSLTKKEYQKLKTSKEVLAKAGDRVQRIAGKGNQKLNEKTYVSTNKKDHDRYTSVLAADGGRSKNKFSMDISIEKDLVSPSQKERVDSFISLLSREIPSADGKSLQKGRDFLPLDSKEKNVSDFELGLKTYNLFSQAQVLNTPLHQEYFKDLRKKGYTALTDDADRGLISDTPVIMFSDLAGAKTDSVKKLKKKDIKEAQSRLEIVKNTRGW